MALEFLQEQKEATPGEQVGGQFGGKLHHILRLDSTKAGVEEKYFWIIRFLQSQQPYGRGYTEKAGTVLKVKDIYTAAETSAYWGSVEQRKGLQIDKFQQLMTNIGSMTKTLFQLLRELRIMDERLEYYERSNKGEEPAEVALKGIWVDMVEGGAKNPGSVLGLAANVGFVTLPDLFFSIHPKTMDDIKREVDKTKEAFNRKVREVLARKFMQYLSWKEKTYKELRVGKQFKLKYLRQHFNVIKLYLNWLRPYLRNIRKLQMADRSKDVNIISAFDTSKIELEILAIKKRYQTPIRGGLQEEREFKKYFPCIRVRWDFVAIPQMAFQEEYQRGAVHRGRTVITVDAFVATEKQIKDYLKKVDDEDLELLKAVDESIDAMKEDIDKYLKEADELLNTEKESFIKEGKQSRSLLTSLLSGFREMFGMGSSGNKPEPGEKEAAKSVAKGDGYLIYKVYKQSHGMLKE